MKEYGESEPGKGANFYFTILKTEMEVKRNNI